MNDFTDYEIKERVEEIKKLSKQGFFAQLHGHRILDEMRDFLSTPNERDMTQLQNIWDEAYEALNRSSLARIRNNRG